MDMGYVCYMIWTWWYINSWKFSIWCGVHNLINWSIKKYLEFILLLIFCLKDKKTYVGRHTIYRNNKTNLEAISFIKWVSVRGEDKKRKKDKELLAYCQWAHNVIDTLLRMWGAHHLNCKHALLVLFTSGFLYWVLVTLFHPFFFFFDR